MHDRVDRRSGKVGSNGGSVRCHLYGFFGTLWSITGLMGLLGWGAPFLSFLLLFLGIAFLAGGMSLLTQARRLPSQQREEGYRRGRRIVLWFNIIFIVQGLAVGTTIVICNTIGRTEMIPAVIALMVGIHFIPLAYLFQVRLYYATGILICGTAVLSLFLPSQIQFGEHLIIPQLSILGFGGALILWVTGLLIWKTANRSLKIPGK
ncbi:hypothetical protein [Alteribacillus sp. HJP-4]|uniref:hypothetical protein n=1 Tax=Alteribacillus sp. HJP-4 TaxID=2775394 RepID=UPI0035CCD647